MSIENERWRELEKKVIVLTTKQTTSGAVGIKCIDLQRYKSSVDKECPYKMLVIAFLS